MITKVYEFNNIKVNVIGVHKKDEKALKVYFKEMRKEQYEKEKN